MTKYQNRMLKVYRNKWIKIGFSTKPCNHKKAEASLKNIYKLIGLKEPKFKWFSEPCQLIEEAVKNGVKYKVALSNLIPSFADHNAAELDYWQNVFHLDLINVDYFIELAQNCAWYSPYKGLCLCCDRPKVIRVDKKQRLNDVDGKPAIEFKNGSTIRCKHGKYISKA